MLFCHQCDQEVSRTATKCPHCGAKPIYDTAQLIVTAVLMFPIIMVFISIMGLQNDIGIIWFGVAFVVSLLTVYPLVNFVFRRIAGNRW